MKTSSYSLIKVKQNFEDFLDKAHIDKVSNETGFSIRKSRKISWCDYTFSLTLCFCKRKNTFSSWADQLGLLCAKQVTKQALFCRKLYLPILQKMNKSDRDQIVSLGKMFSWVCENTIGTFLMSEAQFREIIFKKCLYEKQKRKYDPNY